MLALSCKFKCPCYICLTFCLLFEIILYFQGHNESETFHSYTHRKLFMPSNCRQSLLFYLFSTLSASFITSVVSTVGRKMSLLSLPSLCITFILHLDAFIVYIDIFPLVPLVFPLVIANTQDGSSCCPKVSPPAWGQSLTDPSLKWIAFTELNIFEWLLNNLS